MHREIKEGTREGLRSALGKGKYILLLLAVGVVLMLLPTQREMSPLPTAEAEQAEEERMLAEVEEQLARILTKIQGVGKVEVMLTLQSGSELVLAQNSALRYSGNTQAPDDYDRTSETVTVSDSGKEAVVVTQQRYPRYRGALVVCEGGGNDAVRLQVIQAVSVLTGLGSDCISVVKWASGATQTVGEGA